MDTIVLQGAGLLANGRITPETVVRLGLMLRVDDAERATLASPSR